MDPVRVKRVGTHTLVTGGDKAAVEAKVAQLVGEGARHPSRAVLVGTNWVAKLEQPFQADSEDDGCKVVRLGLQIIVTGPDRPHVENRVRALIQQGANLKSGPEEKTGVWMAVLDESGVEKEPHRWN